MILPEDTELAPDGVTAVSSAPTPAHLRVLFIDDEPAVARAMVRMLRPVHDVVAETSARVALERLAREDFDVIVCDLMMPEMDGQAFFVALGERAPHLVERCLFISGGAVTRHVQAFAREVVILDKPVKRERLLEAIAKASRRGRESALRGATG